MENLDKNTQEESTEETKTRYELPDGTFAELTPEEYQQELTDWADRSGK